MDHIDSIELQSNKIRLRHVSSISRDEMIQKNLMPLQENISKKRIAQAHYYDTQTACIPSVRDSEEKVPVHARLGLPSRNKHRVPLIGTNTNALLPRNRFNYNKGTHKKLFSAQYRLHRIRQQQKMNQSPLCLTTSNLKRIRLQRNIPSLKVEVVNDNKPSQMHSRFRLCLNPVYQEEIRQIQLSHPRQIIHGVHPINPVATNQTLNERFSYLS